jgi:hypothetical protein
MPSGTIPARLSRVTTSSSNGATNCCIAAVAMVAGSPASRFRPLIDTGTPWKDGRSPAVPAVRASLSRASSRAWSPSTRTKLLSSPSRWSIRSRYASTSSRAESSRSRISRACSRADVKTRSVMLALPSPADEPR